eukprot:366426-Chlamydomonas_euryale.AAC.32
MPVARLKVGIADAHQGLQLLVREAGALRQSAEKHWDDVDAAQHGLRAHAAWVLQCQQYVCKGLPATAKHLCRAGVLQRVHRFHEAKVTCLVDPTWD